MSSITIQSWGTSHRVTTGKEIENDRYRNEGGPVQSETKQSESPNPCNLSMASLKMCVAYCPKFIINVSKAKGYSLHKSKNEIQLIGKYSYRVGHEKLPPDWMMNSCTDACRVYQTPDKSNLSWLFFWHDALRTFANLSSSYSAL